MRILYVEDNNTNVILVQRVANMGKHVVVTYDNGQEALDNFATDAPDCVLMDVQLRGALNGLDVVRKLRERGCKLPIIALTAYAMKGDRQRCIEAGCDDYIAKPISVSELVSVFKRFSEALIASKPAAPTGVPEVKPPSEIATESKPAAETLPKVEIPAAAETVPAVLKAVETGAAPVSNNPAPSPLTQPVLETSAPATPESAPAGEVAVNAAQETESTPAVVTNAELPQSPPMVPEPPVVAAPIKT